MPRILIAEDERDIRELITITLEFSGFEVVEARDGKEALEIISADNTFDLIIMDGRMPRMTGYEACRAIKDNASTSHIPIVFLSAKGQQSEVDEGRAAGAIDYILKPFDPLNLVSKINEILAA